VSGTLTLYNGFASTLSNFRWSRRLIVNGVRNGLNSIARGSLPLALFGPAPDPIWMGRLATPTLIAGALAPSAAALFIDTFGSASTLQIISTLAAMNVPLVLFLIIRDTNLTRM
jgi:hypothetical protein